MKIDIRYFEWQMSDTSDWHISVGWAKQWQYPEIHFVTNSKNLEIYYNKDGSKFE